MKLRGPVLTLLAVVALAALMLGLNLSRTPDQKPDRAAQTAPASPGTSQQSTLEQAAAPQVRQAAFPAQQVYTGRSAGDEVTVAIAIKNGQAAAYICDGQSIEVWLEGTVTDGQLTLHGKDNARVTVDLDDGAVFGRIRVDGKQWPYSAQVAEPPAGLYEGQATIDGRSNRIGWIVLPSGDQVGIRTVDGEPQPAPRLDPTAGGVTINGVFVEADPVAGGDDVWQP